MKEEILEELNIKENHERECKLAAGGLPRAYGRLTLLLLIQMVARFCLVLGNTEILLQLKD